MIHLFSAMSSETAVIIAALVAAAVMVMLLFFSFLFKYYKRCPSNRVLVIYGKSGGSEMPATCIHGGATFVVPILQDYEWLSLEPMRISIALRNAMSSDDIRVNVQGIFTVAIGTTPELMQNASIRLLGLSTSEIETQTSDIIFSQLRQVIASMKLEDVKRNHDMLQSSIQDSLEPELQQIGLVQININITDIADESAFDVEETS